MEITLVYAHVKPEAVEAFKKASLDNAQNSVKEPGIARFDVVQQTDDPTRFVLIEVYRSAEAPARHHETAHYKRWRETVETMMAEPRTKATYTNLFPGENGWG
jgi:(4S)-4-hydroxy-5-phosphonooxypentane-2,3-dione isomerase